MQVVLKGVTQKGKNRVKEHGSAWKVIDTKNDLVLFQSLTTGYLKWGPAPDFEVEETCFG